jgi:hypothetical protein
LTDTARGASLLEARQHLAIELSEHHAAQTQDLHLRLQSEIRGFIRSHNVFLFKWMLSVSRLIVATLAMAAKPQPALSPRKRGRPWDLHPAIRRRPPTPARTLPLANFSARGSSTNVNFTLGDCGTDIVCSSGSACACNTASGIAKATTLGMIHYSVEFLSDANTVLFNEKRNVGGSLFFSDCTGFSGLIALTFATNTVNMDTAGLLCYTVHDQIAYTGTYTVTGGGGKYTSAYGGGNGTGPSSARRRSESTTRSI